VQRCIRDPIDEGAIGQARMRRLDRRDHAARSVQALCDASPFGAGCTIYPKRDLWHPRSQLFTEAVDFLIGNTCGKYLERDVGTPLVRQSLPTAPSGSTSLRLSIRIWRNHM
jgi:hypothetical protein